MKKLIAPLMTLAVFAAAVFATNTQFQTRVVSTATFTLNLQTGQFVTINNFTQTGTATQRGVIIAGIFPTPVPTPTPTPTAIPTATPTLSTSASPAFAVVGDTLNDTATLFTSTPSGTITFTLQDPNNVVIYTDIVAVTSNGVYSTSAGNNSGGTPAPTAGPYLWSASYNGDVTANDDGENETVVVTATATPPPTPAPTPTPTPTPVNANVMTAAISGASPAEFVRPLVIAGPAVITINPVSGAILAITYRKGDQPSGSPTPSPSTTVNPGSVSTSTSNSSVGVATTGSSQSAVASDSMLSDEDDSDFTTPSPTPTPFVSPSISPTPTPTASPPLTPTPSPIPTPSP